ncbi:MAG: amidohydrolase [Candidatus Bathyarchaeia archaeon]
MEGIEEEKRTAFENIESRRDVIFEMSDTIFHFAEPGLREYKSSKLLVNYLKREGFEVEEGISGMPTAFIAKWGEGHPEIGFFAEYDATPGHSQKPIAREEPEVRYGPGFTDAHNMLGVASCVAATALKATAERYGLRLKIRLLGTPAEKLCVGKPYMARDGYFDGMDAVLAWHPGGPTTVLGEVWPLAYKSMVFNFKVEAAMGGQSGDLSYPGALDAVHIMYNNVNILKEHMTPIVRRGGSISEFLMTGGQATVATPEYSQIVYAWRTKSLIDQEEVSEMISRCADAAALVTGCVVEKRLITAVRTGLPNSVMTHLVMRNLRLVGPPRHTEEDKSFAREIQANLGLKPMDEPYNETIIEPEKAYDGFHPADDVNEFTWHAPTARLYVSKSLNPPKQGYRYPRWVESALCGTSATHRMGETAAKILVFSAIDLVKSPEILRQAWREFNERRGIRLEDPLIPEGVKPPVNLRWPEWIDRPGSQWWIPDP